MNERDKESLSAFMDDLVKSRENEERKKQELDRWEPSPFAYGLGLVGTVTAGIGGMTSLISTNIGMSGGSTEAIKVAVAGGLVTVFGLGTARAGTRRMNQEKEELIKTLDK